MATKKQKDIIINTVVIALTIALGTWLVVAPIRDFLVETLNGYSQWLTVFVGFFLISIGVIYGKKLANLISGK